jgi:hypothetical protein
MPKVDLGKPYLRTVRLVRKYELAGVAFVEGYEKTVSFTFHSGSPEKLSLQMEDLYQAKYVYDYFRSLFKNCADEESGMQKSLGLFVEWTVTKAKQETTLSKIENAIGADWRDAFRTILSVYEK